ncbi:MAG: flagellar motor protein MotA [Deltaproteobacteria bacterium]|nr:MAG: flagellar motor protein MotA [Deltaproteobacteria bacterium]
MPKPEAQAAADPEAAEPEKGASWYRHRNLLGLILFCALFVGGFAIHGNLGLYFNLAGLMIILGGIFGAAVISFRLDRLMLVCRVLKSSFRKKVTEPEDIVEVLVDLSLKSKFHGLLSLEADGAETTVIFLRRALGFLVDGYPESQMRELLNTEMVFFRLRRDEIERVLIALADFSPSFGLVGSVVGLIGMLAGIGDTAIILKTIPVALTSTLYGIIFANFVFLPLAAHLRELTNRELLLQKMIMEGVIAIGSDLHPRILEEQLKSFLTPSSRDVKLVSIERIREKFQIQPSDMSRMADATESSSEESEGMMLKQHKGAADTDGNNH